MPLGVAMAVLQWYNTWTHILILSELAETPNTGRLDILGLFYSKYTIFW